MPADQWVALVGAKPRVRASSTKSCGCQRGGGSWNGTHVSRYPAGCRSSRRGASLDGRTRVAGAPANPGGDPRDDSGVRAKNGLSPESAGGRVDAVAPERPTGEARHAGLRHELSDALWLAA